jgi:Mg2+/Co2+ transporter CorC
VLFVPASMLASDLMQRMQANRIQMALVIDEYGGTDGLVSLEDIVEMVVGDIADEHDDEEETLISKAGEDIWIVDAKAELEDLAKEIGSDFDIREQSEEVDTIGGLIFSELGRVPARGEVVQALPGFEFHVTDADPRRVKRVRIVASARLRAAVRPVARLPPRKTSPKTQAPHKGSRPVAVLSSHPGWPSSLARSSACDFRIEKCRAQRRTLPAVF